MKCSNNALTYVIVWVLLNYCFISFYRRLKNVLMLILDTSGSWVYLKTVFFFRVLVWFRYFFFICRRWQTFLMSYIPLLFFSWGIDWVFQEISVFKEKYVISFFFKKTFIYQLFARISLAFQTFSSHLRCRFPWWLCKCPWEQDGNTTFFLSSKLVNVNIMLCASWFLHNMFFFFLWRKR